MTICGLRWRTTFVALENAHFRWLWIGRLATSATMTMSSVAQGWLVYKLTNSAFALGYVGAGWAVSSLILSLYGGVVTDRVEKRTLLLWVRMGMLLNSLAIGVLVSTDLIRVWQIAVSSLVTGVMFAFLMPAQQALISDLVDRETLLNAVSLNSVGMGLMGIATASLSGIMIEATGVASVYYAMTGLYVLSVLTILKLPKTGVPQPTNKSVWQDLKDGVRYLKVSPMLIVMLLLGLVRVLFVMPYNTLLPALARDNLGLDASGLGLLMSVTSVGGLVSSLALCAAGDMRNKGKLLIQAGIWGGVALALFAGVPWLGASFVLIGLVGAFNNVCMVLNNTLLQSHADTEYRGRVLSVYMMTWGLTPLGSLPAGALADRFGVPPVIIGQGLIVVVLFAIVALWQPDLKKLS